MTDIIKKYIGQLDSNKSTWFPDADFRNKMIAAGWHSGVRWCCYFAKMVWREYYKNNPVILTILDLLFVDKIVDTFRNFEANGMFTISNEPVPGAIAMYEWVGRNRKETGTSFMVMGVNDDFFSTTELQYFRGDLKIVESKRKMNKKPTETGLNLLGFIHPLKQAI